MPSYIMELYFTVESVLTTIDAFSFDRRQHASIGTIGSHPRSENISKQETHKEREKKDEDLSHMFIQLYYDI